jgi:hypothetical protein
VGFGKGQAQVTLEPNGDDATTLAYTASAQPRLSVCPSSYVSYALSPTFECNAHISGIQGCVGHVCPRPLQQLRSKLLHNCAANVN